ncbi:MAG TPA: undecaprenyldiphospho-muramoylpentapeptide beta-N-acetylglucosaminyltransferase [Candidatus Gastranaerophilaceae bacterium]|nr:undecaprenyldiphospho-muramoylpentapeptide beta-N-acetylglucosaminyltransferase [Candidatus Gastranaerophilaceae bacterium]
MSDTYDKKNKYIYFITGGGTGGHIYPAIAVFDALKNDPDTKEIYYVGNPDNLEFEITKKAGYKFLGVKISAMPRKIGFLGLNFLIWFFQLQAATFKALFYIKKYKPDAIFGTGGYVSAPALFAANLADVPFMIHDCDVKPGILSRYISPMAKTVSLAFEGAKEYMKSQNINVNGNPIRESFFESSKKEAREKLGIQDKMTLCIMGGSQGAKSINTAAVGVLKYLCEQRDVQIIFQTGKKKFDEVTALLKEIYPEFESNKNLILKPYIDDMASVLKASDIAVSRAGSLSLSELCASGVASILIPYPHAAADHQRKNADFMVKERAALYLEDADTTKDTLLIAIEQILDSQEKLKIIQENAFALAKPKATKDIVGQLKGIIFE